jgi:hypothetical protein
MKSNSKKIRELEAELKELRKLEKNIKTLSPIQQIAFYAHDCLCKWGHTDSKGCKWFKESPMEWEKETHSLWIRKAETILKYIETNKLGRTDLQKITKAKDLIDMMTYTIYHQK